MVAPLLFGNSPKRDGLIGQLGDGWKRLRDLYPKSRIVVHLVTNQTPSVNDRITVNGRHTAAFVEEVWRQAKGDQIFRHGIHPKHGSLRGRSSSPPPRFNL